MKDCVVDSVRLNDEDELLYDPFLLLKDVHEPTLFEITFLQDSFYYRYGFRYYKATIEDEWLFRKTTSRSKEHELFIRNANGIAINEEEYPEGNIGNNVKLNNNRLFLSLCAQLGGNTAKKIVSWFLHDLKVIGVLENEVYRSFSKTFFHEKEEESKDALKFFKQLQLGFERLLTHEVESIPDGISKEKRQYLSKERMGMKQIEIDSVHNLYNHKGAVCGTVKFTFDERESSGTRKIFDLAGPIFDTLYHGSTLIIDELDAKMHPAISQHIIGLFNAADSNPRNAQLLFTTHDTHLLSRKRVRRDQIWFTEKDATEQTDLYCLMDVVLPDGSKPGNGTNYERNYNAGRYGAIPYIINE